MPRYLHQIADDADATSGAKAEECLRAMGELCGGGPNEDLALPDLRVAAQAYATLAVAEAISDALTAVDVRTAYSGLGIADLIAHHLP